MGTRKQSTTRTGLPLPHAPHEYAEGTIASIERALDRALPAPDPRPAVHVIGLPHTMPDESFSHCAFTGKLMRLPAVLHQAGYRVVTYANGPTCGEADQHVSIFTEAQLEGFFGKSELRDEITTRNTLDKDVAQVFALLVKRELRKRVQAGDIIAHVYPTSAQAMTDLANELPDCIHVESGIGYAHGPAKGVYRIFESETWRAWHFGRYTLTDNGGGGTWPNYPEVTGTAVAANYYNVEDWALGAGDGMPAHPGGETATKRPAGMTGEPYVFFAGRMTSSKGIEIVNALAERFPALAFVVASGEPKSDRLTAANVHFIGRVSARAELARWYGGALCTLMPTRFHEPFGGVHVESLLCGTPVLVSDFAVFTETVQDGDGLRCMTLDDFATGLEIVQANGAEWQGSDAGHGPRVARQARARARWGIEPVALQYRGALESFRRQHAQGIKP